ncbi:4842_t:CDS:2 [Cetraspora pellucida]|uniref:Alpha-1,3/1,6-mannosyltransferase ALG2 n=1 Tax=Cetraspora pellucida TaxID=1433469 RepID=A0A9N9B7E1_9GLOM|nr:4842_t:CDS:2 [Cetraspora pellucida]
MSSKTLRVAFVHPDLGIGGAERLVVDAATGLKAKGHNVVIYTSHHDRGHCFEETKDGSLEIRVRGNSIIPRTLFGSFYIVCAILRQLHLTASLILRDNDQFDVIFVDQLSASIPFLRFTGAKILFYCHFPDKLLTKRESILKKLYRYPVDLLEGLTTGYIFTSNVFRESFPNIRKAPQVLYPGIHFEAYDKKVDVTILSINRFERKKNIVLAIRAFARLRDDVMVSEEQFLNMRLVIAGGYDNRVPENVDHHKELDRVASRLELETFTIMPSSATYPPESAQIIFLCSFNEAQRTYLLSKSLCLLYTPSNEHFGIVPIEAMYACLPVIACNSGGPRETVRNGITGVLCSPTPLEFSEAIADFISGVHDRKVMGDSGREHAQKNFSLTTFVNSLELILMNLVQDPLRSRPLQGPLIWFSTAITLFVLLIYQYSY